MTASRGAQELSAAVGPASCRLCADELGRIMRGQLLAEAAQRCVAALGDPARFVDSILPAATEDLHALVAGDPAARASCRYALASYRCFRAVLVHRLAHAMVKSARRVNRAQRDALLISARCMSERAKVQTGVEIHPEAVIGRRFVVDHGIGTVIGETVRIGDDCYILQGVVLGSTGIAGNARGRRHPLLGSRVQVGAFARVLGAIEIGDDALIGPHCVVTRDVAAGSRVILRNPQQVICSSCRPPRAPLHATGAADAARTP